MVWDKFYCFIRQGVGISRNDLFFLIGSKIRIIFTCSIYTFSIHIFVEPNWKILVYFDFSSSGIDKSDSSCLAQFFNEDWNLLAL